MPTITTVDTTWTNGVAMDEAELRRADTAMFLGDGSANGVRGGIVRHGDTSLAVSVNGSDQVTVQAGAAVIPAATGLGAYRASLAAATSATAIDPRNATNPRIDLVVFRTSGAVDIITGTPGSSPSAPALPSGAVELARLNVPKVAGGAVAVDNSFRAYATGLGGTLYVQSAARLPGSGNVVGQRAVVLGTGDEHTWTGSGWWATRADPVGVTASPNVTSSSVQVFVRGWGAIVNVNVTATAALGADQSLFNISAPNRPPVQIFGDLTEVSDTPSATYRITCDTDGTVRTRVPVASGTILRGQIFLPL